MPNFFRKKHFDGLPDYDDKDASGEVERGGIGGELDRGQEVSEQVWKQVSDLFSPVWVWPACLFSTFFVDMACLF